MRIKLDLQNNRSRRRDRQMPPGYFSAVWRESMPFVWNTRGVLIHRVKAVTCHYRDYRLSHWSISYECENGCTGDSNSLQFFDDPPKSRILCQRCESAAVARGLPSAEQLTGRHVCVGGIRPHRTCCTDEEN